MSSLYESWRAAVIYCPSPPASDAKRSLRFTGQDSAHPVRLRSDQRSGLLGDSARVAYTNLFPQSQRLSETRSVRTCTRFSWMRLSPVRRLRQPAAEFFEPATFDLRIGW